MRTHRFYTGPSLSLVKSFWLHDKEILHQWTKVFRYKVNQEVVLFNGSGEDRLYRIACIKEDEVHLELKTQLEPNIPKRKVYLFWSLLKRQNNEFLLQKCTELGVAHFIPLITDRTIKKDLNVERAQKILIEASEQCGRSDIPHIRQPIHLEKAIEEYKTKLNLLVCEKGADYKMQDIENVGLIVGPEGGWSKEEKQIFSKHKLSYFGISSFTLRAETAAIVASSKLLQ